jgi:LPXTG-motif cell wall-anchored protein
MKTSKIAAGGLGVALVAALTLGGAASTASAADFYVTSVGTETPAGYPEGWFSGTATPQGTAAFTPYGLEIDGKYQLLNGTPPTQDVSALAANAGGFSDDGDWFFQIPIFGNPTGTPGAPGAAGQQYTTLVPSADGTTSTAIDWRTTGAIYDGGGNVVIAANTTTTFAAITAALGAVGAYEILAYGFFWDTGVEDTLYEAYYGPDTFYFTPQLTVAVSPNPVSIGDFTAAGKGVTITATGVYPFETVLFELYAPGKTGVNIGEAEADENGVATLQYVAPAGSVAGAYSVVAYEIEGDDAAADFTVALAATGAEFNPALFIGATSLLLAGAVLVIVRSRKATA